MSDVVFAKMMVCLIMEAYILSISANFDLSIFDPIRNYGKWIGVNLFGVIILTLILNVIFIPYAFCYWMYKVFTVGRI